MTISDTEKYKEIRNWRSRYPYRHVIIDKRKYNTYFYSNTNDQSILKYIVNFIPGTQGNINKILYFPQY